MTAADPRAVIEEALEAAMHISECGEHQDHLDDAERKARKAYFALASLKREREALRDLMSTVDLVCDSDAQAKGYDVLSPYARSALELSLGRARAAFDGEQEETRNQTTTPDVQAAARIAADFAEIPFANHEARILARAYLELQEANQRLRDDVAAKIESLAAEPARADAAERYIAKLNERLTNWQLLADAAHAVVEAARALRNRNETKGASWGDRAALARVDDALARYDAAKKTR